ncbi:MAG: ABC transporter substrate-binding protein [Gemmatimonas sp.]
MRSIAPKVIVAALAAASVCAAAKVACADMPPSAARIIADLKLGPEVTDRWEDEQVVPRTWLEGARREGALKINGSWEPKVFAALSKPFTERYPFIKINYTRGSNVTRVQGALIAFGEGRYIADVVTGIDSSVKQFRQLDALADLGILPNIRNIPDAMRGRDDLWASVRIRYWCMSYNPTRISADEMPKTWDDLITTPKLRDHKLALWRGVSSWLLPLWGAKGEAWASDYVKKLFEIVKPQKRKEGANALVKLVIAGEFNASLASAEYQVKEQMGRGAPVAWHCPDIVPVSASTVGILKGNPDMNASRLFLNWLLSREGQIFQYVAEGSPPVHQDLQKLGFMPFPEMVAGKRIAFRNPEQLDDDITAMFNVLNPYWDGTATAGD